MCANLSLSDPIKMSNRLDLGIAFLDNTPKKCKQFYEGHINKSPVILLIVRMLNFIC